MKTPIVFAGPAFPRSGRDAQIPDKNSKKQNHKKNRFHTVSLHGFYSQYGILFNKNQNQAFMALLVIFYPNPPGKSTDS
jgi:hypothetical protein